VPRICDIGLIKPGLNGIFHSSPQPTADRSQLSNRITVINTIESLYLIEVRRVRTVLLKDGT
jgi:hypothetical protein